MPGLLGNLDPLEGGAVVAHVGDAPAVDEAAELLVDAHLVPRVAGDDLTGLVLGRGGLAEATGAGGSSASICSCSSGVGAIVDSGVEPV